MPGRNELVEELKELKKRKMELDKGWIPLRDQARKVDEKIKERETAIRIIGLLPRVSDHAIFRYLQRKYGVDFDAIRDEILTDKVKEAIRLGASAITVDGYKYVISEGCITTILGKDQSILPRKSMRERKRDLRNEALLAQQEEYPGPNGEVAGSSPVESTSSSADNSMDRNSAF